MMSTPFLCPWKAPNSLVMPGHYFDSHAMQSTDPSAVMTLLEEILRQEERWLGAFLQVRLADDQHWMF